MLRERVDDSPQKNNPAVEPFLTTPSSPEPHSANVKGEYHQYTISNERGAHNVVCETLSSRPSHAVASEGHCAQQHLCEDTFGQ